MAVFRGIPFAEPRVGALRFAAPRPVDSEQRLAQVYAAQPKVARYPEETSRLMWQQHHTFAPLTPLSTASGCTARLAP